MTTCSLAYRSLISSDAAAVAALIRAAFGSYSPPLAPPPSALRESAESVAAHLQSGGGGAVAVADGQIVGCVLWSLRDGALYLGRMSVAAAWRGGGVATQLVAAGEAEARARGLPRLLVGVRLALAGNRRLFAGLGFRDTTLHAHDGYSEPTWVDMEKSLD